MSDEDYQELLKLRETNKNLTKQLVLIQQQLKDALNGNKELSQQLKDLQGKLDILITQITKRNQRDYGPKTERHNPKPALATIAAPIDVAPVKPPKKPVARNHEKHILELVHHFTPEQVHHSVSPDQLLCPTCVIETVVFDHEVTYQLEKLTQTLKLLEHNAEVRSCPKCKQHVVTAEKPLPPIPGSYAGPALLANIVTEKFDDAMPLNRQEKKFKREKAIIPRSTQSGWVIETASTLALLYTLLKKHVLSSKCVKTDDSEIKVQDRKYKGKMRKGKMSVYLGDKHHKSTVFDFSPNKSFAKNKEFLKDFKGYVQADAANGFDVLFKDGSIIEVGCNTHARRGFFEGLTLEIETCNEILNIYGKLYDIEKDIKNKTPEERLLTRQTKSLPLMNTLHLKLVALKDTLNPTNPLMVWLAEVANPSALFLGDRDSVAPGTAVFAGLEGTRPLLCEIQALVAASSYGTPRRAVVGWDTGRLAMILAVLDARAGVGIGGADVYLNVAGGLKIAEPAADLAAAAALISSFGGEPLPRDCVFFGEISLSGDIRPVPQAELRLKEAAKLGFKSAYIPKGTKADGSGLKLTEVNSVNDLLGFAGTGRAKRAAVVEFESMNLSFTIVDYLVAAVIIISAGYAAYRGFVNETLTIFAWVAAGFATLYFGPWLVPLARSRIALPWLASVAAYAGVFLVVFIPLSLMGHRFSRTVKNSAIGPLDRVLGIGFGVVRGLVIVGLAYLAFSYFAPARRQPEWLLTARTLPLLRETARVMLAALPSQTPRDSVTAAPAKQDRLGDLIREQSEQANSASETGTQTAAKKGEKTYRDSDRRALDKLFQTSSGGK